MRACKRFVTLAVFGSLVGVNLSAQQPAEPRIKPLEQSEYTAAHAEALGPYTVSNTTNTCAKNLNLCKKLRPWMFYFVDPGSLQPRERELLILRTAWHTKSHYEWTKHVPIATTRGGLTSEDVLRVPKGPDAKGWSDGDALLLRAADELHEDAFIKDSTWKGLAARYDDPKLLEILFTVGEYHMLAMFMNGAGLQNEVGPFIPPGKLTPAEK